MSVTTPSPSADLHPEDLARFSGLARLYGWEGLRRLLRARVCVVGIGGVGSWAVEALARSGIGHLTLIDLDDVCVSNTNRQLHALTPHIGQPKVEVMASRARLINPRAQVHAVADFFTPSRAEHLLPDPAPFDFLLDAIDALGDKCALLARCRDLGLPAVTVGGAGGRRDPTRIVTADLGKSAGDPLLRHARRTLRRDYGFPTQDAPWGVISVFSAEPPVYPSADGETCGTERPDPSANLRLDCASGFGTASFVTGAFGLVAAGAVVSAIAQGERGIHSR
jgi:tRNA threonylcarbamoyladenosine dehydratase